MLLRKWEQLPPEMQNDAVRKYYDILKNKRVSLIFKRIFDAVAASVLLILLSPLFLLLAVAIKLDSDGPVFYRQERVTQYGRRFRIFKFRSMVQDADKGLLVTVRGDSRVTRVGGFIRKYRLDEISQLLNVLTGDMSFVGARPEVPKYVARYTPEMMATLLLPSGITGMASILYRDEAELLDAAEDTDEFYVEKVLPEKMLLNLHEIEQFGFWREIRVMLLTLCAVCGMKYKGKDTVKIKKEQESESFEIVG